MSWALEPASSTGRAKKHGWSCSTRRHLDLDSWVAVLLEAVMLHRGPLGGCLGEKAASQDLCWFITAGEITCQTSCQSVITWWLSCCHFQPSEARGTGTSSFNCVFWTLKYYFLGSRDLLCFRFSPTLCNILYLKTKALAPSEQSQTILKSIAIT